MPIDDPWWDTHTPPLAWGCECGIRNTDKAATTIPDDVGDVNPVLANNPAKTAEFLNTAKHPYVKGVCKEFATCQYRKGSLMQLADKPNKPICAACKISIAVKDNSAKNVRKWAQNVIQGTIIKHPKLNTEIEISGGGIREFTNQNHSHFYEKNKLLTNIAYVIENSTYMGITHYKGRTSHIFEIEIKGDKSWIIANEYKGRGIVLYSISESPKVLIGIEKPK